MNSTHNWLTHRWLSPTFLLSLDHEYKVTPEEGKKICKVEALCKRMPVRSIQSLPECKLPFKPREEGITFSKVHIYFSSVSLWTPWHQKGINRSHLWSMFLLVLRVLLFFCLCEAISAIWIVLSISSTVPVCQYHTSLLCVCKGLGNVRLSSQKSTEWNCMLDITASLQSFFTGTATIAASQPQWVKVKCNIAPEIQIVFH